MRWGLYASTNRAYNKRFIDSVGWWTMNDNEVCEMDSCSICADLASPKSPVWNRPLLRTENFVVLPSLGALVEGWLLIVPTRHYLCLGALPASVTQEFRNLQDCVYSILVHRYGYACAFEHGPSVAHA